MASLSGQNPSATFPSLIKTINNNPISASLIQLSDGNGVGFPMQISTTTVEITGSITSAATASFVATASWAVSASLATRATSVFVIDNSTNAGEFTFPFILTGSAGTGLILSGDTVPGITYNPSSSVTKITSLQATGSLFGTSSWASSATQASNTFILNAPASSTGDFTMAFVSTGSIGQYSFVTADATPGILYSPSASLTKISNLSATGSLFGTSSWASNASNSGLSSFTLFNNSSATAGDFTVGLVPTGSSGYLQLSVDTAPGLLYSPTTNVTKIINLAVRETLTATGSFTVTGSINVSSGLQNFVDDAAAAAGGIAVNQFYRSGSIVMIRVS